VEGLTPDAVSVLDMNGNLLGRPKPQGSLDGAEPSEAVLDYRHKVEADLLAKINSTLEPVVGAEKFKAGVSVECDFSGGEQSEEVFDPARSVMVNSQRSEDTLGSSGGSGVPGTPSTLPRPASRPGSSSTRVSRVTENIQYQSSRTVKKTHMPAGVVQKMSIAVLVDQDVTWQRDRNGFQRVLVPPTAEKLKVIRDLVAGITGFRADRGDQLVIETLPFETTLLLEPPAQPGAPSPARPAAPQGFLPQWDRKTLLIAGGAMAVVIVLGIAAGVLIRRKKRRAVHEVALPSSLPAAERSAAAALEAGETEQQIESKLAERESLQQKMDAQALNTLKLAPVITKTAEVLAKHLREKVKQDPEISSQVLRSWIREEES
jgi:flagellar M-ring protein FliF